MSWQKGWKLGGKIENSFRGFKNRVKARPAKQADIEIVELIEQVVDRFDQSEVLANLDPFDLAASVSMQAAIEAGVPIDNPLIDSFMDVVITYGEYEAIYGINTDIKIPDTNAGKADLRNQLKHRLALYENDKEVVHVFVYFLAAVFERIYKSLPSVCLQDQSLPCEGSKFDTHILNLVDDVYELVESICIEFYHDDLKDVTLFDKTRDILQVNGQLAAGINPQDPANYGKNFPPPTECRKMEADAMVSAFFRKTPLKNIFLQKLPFRVPVDVRMEHMHVLAGSGHGKTQLLQKLVLDDIESGTGFCVIDSQGDLITKLLLCEKLSPSLSPDILDRLMLIDASDVEFPTSLNLFALNDQKEELSLKDKEILANSTIDLYTYIFSSLLGAELTARQGTIFVYIAKLMMEIPGASILTLRELMEDGEQFRVYMDRLQGSANAFFKTQFFSRTFIQTKKQILYRLWAVLSNSVLERMFSNKENKIDLFKAMNSGQIVLINTSKQVLGQIGSGVMGKFFIAMLTQSAIKRAAIKERKRKPFHVYIDEAYEYVDPMFNQFLNQTRKYKVGFALFHQNYDQLPVSVRASVLSSTSIKFAGGVSAKDAKALAEEMKTTTSHILSVKKHDRSHAEYSLYVQNITPQAVTVDVQFGLLENLPLMAINDYESLIENNRQRYCRHISEINLENNHVAGRFVNSGDSIETGLLGQAKKTIQATQNLVQELEVGLPTSNHSSVSDDVYVPDTKQRSAKHKYLQAMVERLGNEFGFIVTLEKAVPSSDGFIDAVLMRDDLKIACEISVTNTPEYEVKNIQKCLNAGYEHVVMLCADPIHMKQIFERAKKFFGQVDFRKIKFSSDELLRDYLKKFKMKRPKEDQTKMHGYKVNVNFRSATPEQQNAKQSVVDKILFSAKLD